MAISEASLAERLGKSDRMVRNYAKTIEQVTGKNPQAGPREYHDWSVAEFDAIVAAGGPKAYERQATQAQPVAVCDMATNPGHEVAGQTQPTQPAFAPVVDVATAPATAPLQLVWVNPNQQNEPAPIATYEPVPVVGLAVPGSAMLANTCQVQNLIQAADAMLDVIDQRFSIGDATIDSQRLATARQIEELRDKKAAIKARARLYRETEIEASVQAQHDAQVVGKLRSELVADGQALGFQLSVRPQSAVS